MSLVEDIGSGDITSEACITNGSFLSGKLIMKQWGKLAGLPFLASTFAMADPNIIVDLYVEEGTIGNAGTIIGSVKGPAKGILSAERVALNILQHASGIATITSVYKEKLTSKGYDCDLLDTRKTLPGLRALERYAVRIGGGKNHRDKLDERFIIQPNHRTFIAQQSTRPIIDAVARTREYRPGVRVEVEVEHLSYLEEALEALPDSILLKHMNVYEVEQAVTMIRNRNKNLYIEVHGGDLVLDTLCAYARLGVNGISVAALTHSTQDLDIRLQF